MNLKDRLENIKKENTLSIKEDNNTFVYDIEKIFADSAEIRTIIAETVSAGKNIAFISDPTIDKSLIIEYFKHILEDKKITNSVFNEVTQEVIFSDLEVSMFATPKMEEVVKILEYAMYGYKSFIFGMNFANSDNIIKKLKTAILINHKNMIEESIEVLLGASNLIFIYFDKNVDGLFYISKVDRITYEQSVVSLDTVIDFQIEKAKPRRTRQVKKEIKDSIEEIEEKNQNAIVEDILSVSANNEEVKETFPEENLQEKIEEVPLKKINKYKLLKEKIKNKRTTISQ